MREKPQIVTYHRVVDRTRVVRGDTKLFQENRVYVHVKPVIHREVVVHRTNTIVRDVYLHRANPIYRQKLVYRHQVVNRYVQGWTRHVREWHEVRGGTAVACANVACSTAATAPTKATANASPTATKLRSRGTRQPPRRMTGGRLFLSLAQR